MIMNSVPWIPYILFHFMFLRLCSSLDTISVSQPIRDGDGGGDVLATIGETFALGFFSPGKSNYRYVGICWIPSVDLVRGSSSMVSVGHWNGIRLSGALVFKMGPLQYYTFVNNDTEISFMWSTYNTSILSRVVIDESGFSRRYIWYEQERGWQPLLSAPRSRVINMDIVVHLVSVILTILRSLNALVSLGLSPSLTGVELWRWNPWLFKETRVIDMQQG
ncbi:hypothetical protein FNV43_RR00231 [Rhamnella rubrinervis]|uniref:S-locus glycoprotein domain-containing protein n=1 Tax=Rhamnella rubrinervis TaxID=2594499 RepID=A0A8K0HMI1_9ROSA|nr:hypothetical protein FNV43_RR00231 [Rhamnella rubrinervis]